VTIEEIRRIGQPLEKMREMVKNYPYVGPAFRKISPYFTRFFIERNVTANQVSALSILLVIVGGLLFTFGDYYLMLIGCVFYIFWLLFDRVDGEIARVTNSETIRGLYLEGVAHSFDSCFFAFFGIGLHKMLGSMIFLFFGFTVALFLYIGKCFMYSREAARKEGIRKKKRYAEYVNPLRKKRSFTGTIYRSIYVKVRYFFHFDYIYFILICILLFELLSPVKLICTIWRIPLTVLSAYFFFSGFGWIFRASIGGVTNYVYLVRD
jgi:phosphatidylglycerophosphate synthase